MTYIAESTNIELQNRFLRYRLEQIAETETHMLCWLGRHRQFAGFIYNAMKRVQQLYYHKHNWVSKPIIYNLILNYC